MFTAAILPTRYLNYAAGNPVHLVLAHMLENPDYAEFYRNESLNGAYTILDNSAHEQGQGQSLDSLIENALKIRAKEIVLPDVLFDRSQTIKRTVEALDRLFDYSDEIAFLKPSLMVVPQGNDRWEVIDCLNKLLEAYSKRRQGLKELGCRSLTVGLSKDYEVCSPRGLIEYVEHAITRIRREDFKVNIHLLGWGRRLSDLKEVATTFQQIRSVDSGKPTTFGYYRIRLNPVKILFDSEAYPYPGRPDNFFDLELTEGQLNDVLWNFRVFQSMAQPRHR